MRGKMAGAAVIAVAGLAWGVWPGASAQEAGGLLPYQDAEAVARGAGIYAQACASCHGTDLEGQPDWQTRGPDGLLPAPPHDETGHTWHHPDEMLIALTALGPGGMIAGYESAMPGFADQLSEAEIREVLAYIKSTWPDEVIAIHNEINARP